MTLPRAVMLVGAVLTLSACASIPPPAPGTVNDWTMQQMQQSAQMANEQAMQQAVLNANLMIIQQQAIMSSMPIQMPTP